MVNNVWELRSSMSLRKMLILRVVAHDMKQISLEGPLKYEGKGGVWRNNLRVNFKAILAL